MNKICILLPYFGKWPVYMPLYLKGCQKNSHIDFLFFTDADVHPNLPSNVKIYPITLKEFNALVSEKLDIAARVESPYKVCDIRPAFALLFDSFIKEYEFWGWGDIDLVYGDLNFFASSSDFQKYDVLSGRKLWVSGALTMLRNSTTVNRLFLTNDDYLSAFSEVKHLSFSECGKKWGQLRRGQSIFDIPLDHKNFTRLVNDFELNGDIENRFQDLLLESVSGKSYVHYKAGKIFDEHGEEFALFHYVVAKKKVWFIYPKWEQIPDEFYITETGFYTVEEFQSKLFPIYSIGRKMGVSHKWVIDITRRIVRRLKNMYS